MDNCKHAYEVRAQAAYCIKCDDWSPLGAALRYTNKRLASTEAENLKLKEVATKVLNREERIDSLAAALPE